MACRMALLLNEARAKQQLHMWPMSCGRAAHWGQAWRRARFEEGATHAKLQIARVRSGSSLPLVLLSCYQDEHVDAGAAFSFSSLFSTQSLFELGPSGDFPARSFAPATP